MAISNFIPDLWSARLIANLDLATVITLGANTNYEGEIRNVGDSVKIQQPGSITVNSYPASADISYESPTSTTKTLSVDQDKYWAFTVDDLDAVQANVNLVDTYTQRAAVAIAEDVDKYLGSLYASQGAGDVTVDLTASSVDLYGTFVDAALNLDENNVPRAGRWAIVTPVVHAALLEDTKFIQASDLGDQTVTTGAVGRVAGMDILVSNNLTESSSTSTTSVMKCLYGTSDSMTYARQLLGQPEALRLEGRFEDAIRGRLAYGAVVVQPDALGTITATQGA